MEKKKLNDSDVSILILGNSNVGKTLLLKRIVEGGGDLEDFQTSVTIGIDFVFVTYDFGKEGTFKVRYIDTPGNATSGNLVSSYYRGLHGLIAVYDVTIPDTFRALCDEWFPTVGKYTANSNLPVLVVANKIDMWKKGDAKLKELTDEHTRKLNIGFPDNLMFDEYVAASVRDYRFVDKEMPIDSFVRKVIKRQLELRGDDLRAGRISLFETDVIANGKGTHSTSCGC